MQHPLTTSMLILTRFHLNLNYSDKVANRIFLQSKSMINSRAYAPVLPKCELQSRGMSHPAYHLPDTFQSVCSCTRIKAKSATRIAHTFLNTHNMLRWGTGFNLGLVRHCVKLDYLWNIEFFEIEWHPSTGLTEENHKKPKKPTRTFLLMYPCALGSWNWISKPCINIMNATIGYHHHSNHL